GHVLRGQSAEGRRQPGPVPLSQSAFVRAPGGAGRERRHAAVGRRMGRWPAVEPAGGDARHAQGRRSRHHRRQSGTQSSGPSAAHAQHRAAVRRLEVERHVPVNWSRGAVIGALAVAASAAAEAQRGGQPPATARAGAPIDLTGYWVSVVTEDWRYRMVTPKKGDFASVPLNAEGRKVVEAWDPAKDVASGGGCKAYGAAAVMRVPGRPHGPWQDDTTLKIENDAGQQTRLLHLGETATAARAA